MKIWMTTQTENIIETDAEITGDVITAAHGARLGLLQTPLNDGVIVEMKTGAVFFQPLVDIEDTIASISRNELESQLEDGFEMAKKAVEVTPEVFWREVQTSRANLEEDGLILKSSLA